MTNTQLVDIVDTWDELLEIFACHLFLESFIFNDEIEELSAFDKLHDKIEVFFCFNDLINLHHIRVMQLFQNFDFSTDSLNILLVFNSWLFKNFHRNLYKMTLFKLVSIKEHFWANFEF